MGASEVIGDFIPENSVDPGLCLCMIPQGFRPRDYLHANFLHDLFRVIEVMDGSTHEIQKSMPSLYEQIQRWILCRWVKFGDG